MASFNEFSEPTGKVSHGSCRRLPEATLWPCFSQTPCSTSKVADGLCRKRHHEYEKFSEFLWYISTLWQGFRKFSLPRDKVLSGSWRKRREAKGLEPREEVGKINANSNVKLKLVKFQL